MDEVTKEILSDVSWCVMFADDTVLIKEKREDINNRLDEWRVAIEGKILRISRSNTELIDYEFGGRDQVVNKTWRVIVNKRWYSRRGYKF